jgi:2-phosphosulfolactate phosphatase
MSYFSQAPYAVRLEWGPVGVQQLAPEVDCIVVLDVMSFSTCVDIAVGRGAVIYPYRWRDETAQKYGAERSAEVASGKRRFGDGWSLSPSSMLKVPAGLRLVLPSPNGSASAYLAKEFGKDVFAACLRNLQATAAACRRYPRILVVPCGERWSEDDSLRPSLEDYLAGGGLVAALGRSNASPEAHAARLAYEGLGAGRADALRGCGSAVELIGRGFAEDVELCLEEDVSRTACRLVDDHFVQA